MLSNQRATGRERRRQRVRKKVWGTDACPRLCVFRSLKHIYVQVISDESGVTLVSASSLTPQLKEHKAKKLEVAKEVGDLVAQACKEKNITRVVFDRNGFLYHGRIRALADAARTSGLSF
jgi:large subunit ribosomal protein L18